MNRLRPKEEKPHAQGDIANQWQSWDQKPWPHSVTFHPGLIPQLHTTAPTQGAPLFAKSPPTMKGCQNSPAAHCILGRCPVAGEKGISGDPSPGQGPQCPQPWSQGLPFCSPSPRYETSVESLPLISLSRGPASWASLPPEGWTGHWGGKSHE